MSPRNVFEGSGTDSQSSSQTVPNKFLLFSSISHRNPFVLIKFSKNSHQIPLVPINILLFSSSSWTIPIKIPLVPIKFPSKSFCSQAMGYRQVSTGERALRWTVRDLGRVLNGAPQFVGRPEGEPQWQADVCRMRQSGKSGFSACQVLWRIAGRSASPKALCRTSSFMCATQESLKREGRKRTNKP